MTLALAAAIPAATHRVAIVRNIYSRHNRGRADAHQPATVAGIPVHEPASKAALKRHLAQLAAEGVETLVVDGGDGTIRDMLTIGLPLFGARMPAIALAPSGKTNALAHDLGIGTRSLEDAVAAIADGRRVTRRALAVTRAGTAVVLHGFLLGSGAFVRATALAQRAHSFGAFNGVAVGLSLASVIGRTLFGGDNGVWRRGEPMALARDGRVAIDHQTYMFLAAALTRFPLGLAPLGNGPFADDRVASLTIDAPPRHLPRHLPALLRGGADDALARAGYHRCRDRQVELDTTSGFVIDGERFDGGRIMIRRGPAVTFIAGR